MPISNFQRILGFDPTSLNVKLYYQNQRLRQLAKVQQYWDWYTGEHWRYAGLPSDVDANSKVTVNLVKAFVDKFTAYLMGKGFNFILPDEQQKQTLQFLNDVWEDNSKQERAVEMAQTGNVTGDCYVYVTLDEAQEQIKLRVFDERYVDPVWDDEDPSKLKKVTLVIPRYVSRNNGEGIIPELSGTGESVEVIITRIVIDKNNISVYRADASAAGVEYELISTQPNSLQEVPVIHIPNALLATERHGLSTLAPLIHLQHQYNDRFSDISEILSYHAAPITIVQGAKVGNLEKGANKVWGGLPKDGKVYNLNLDTDLTASLSFLALIKQHLHEIAGIPEGILGKERAISNTSGVAIGLEYQPLTDINNMRQVTYGRGISNICRIMLRYAEVYQSVRTYYDYDLTDLPDKKRLRYKVDVQFPDPLPKDELAALQVIVQRVTNKLQSKKDALLQLGVENPEEMMKEIFEETKKEMELQQQFMPKKTDDSSDKQPVNPAVLQNHMTPKGAADKEMNGKNGETSDKNEGRARG